MSAYILIGLITLVGAFVQSKLKSKFKEYSKMPLHNGMSGKEIAEKMLHDNGINDVEVISVRGRLTDHYNPLDKTVNLSEVVYHERNVAAAAVAAHECGHAVQHAVGYPWLKFRSSIVPVVSISSKLAQWILIAGIFMVHTFPQLLLFGILLFAGTVIFSFITLPVEYDASNRALQWLDKAKILNSSEHKAAKDALKWAARTYVVAAISSLATLLYYLNIYNDRR
ncbi:MAG TPA: zinc metallopeptidase [Flavobacteriia bacterium]|nr:zinc metallopeptidase [Flavobacteriia bacterium]